MIGNEISGLQIMDALTPKFREDFKQFLPQWLNSLLPYYKEAKTEGVDVFG